MATTPQLPARDRNTRTRLLQVLGACAVIGLLIYFFSGKSSGSQRREPVRQMVNITIPPPPPPPPPPKPKPSEPPPPSTEQPMISETAVEPDPAPAAPASNDAPLGTGIKGDGGADSFGLGTGPGGGGGGGSRLASSGGGTRWAGYAGTVKNRIMDALRGDDRTRFASGQIDLGIWLDVGGRITRVAVRGSTTDDAVAQAIKTEVLPGLQIQPPPADMPQPIWLRTTLRLPN